MNKILKWVIIMLMTAFPSILTACNGKVVKVVDKTYTNFISTDSTLSFTFIGTDSLYVDTYESGCGIEQYRLENIQSNGKSIDKIDMTFTGVLTIYDYYDNVECIEKHYIRIYKNVVGNHYEYFIRFDNDDPIPIYLTRMGKMRM